MKSSIIYLVYCELVWSLKLSKGAHLHLVEYNGITYVLKFCVTSTHNVVRLHIMVPCSLFISWMLIFESNTRPWYSSMTLLYKKTVQRRFRIKTIVFEWGNILAKQIVSKSEKLQKTLNLCVYVMYKSYYKPAFLTLVLPYGETLVWSRWAVQILKLITI